MNPPRRYFYINNLSHIHKSKNYLSKNDVNKTRLSCLYTCKRFPSIPYWTNTTYHYYQHSKSHTYRVRYKTRSCCMKRKSWAITPLLFYHWQVYNQFTYSLHIQTKQVYWQIKESPTLWSIFTLWSIYTLIKSITLWKGHILLKMQMKTWRIDSKHQEDKHNLKKVLDWEKEYMHVQGDRRWIVLLSHRSKRGGILH